MPLFRALCAFVALASIAGCAVAPAEPSLEPAESSTSAQRESVDEADPIAHLRVIASPEMEGRNTPSVGLRRATDYVIAACVRAGLVGAATPSPAAERPYEQPFTVAGSTVHNVVALLPGSGPHADEAVLLSAHLDHLGRGFPGADDNGSGSATLLAIAHRLAASRADRPLDRSVAFLWTVAEEKGLLGSAHFAANPPPRLPLAKIAQVINLDAIGALDTTRFSLLPDEAANSRTTLEIMTAVSGEMDPPFTRINYDLSAYTRRTDAYNFVRRNVPAIWVSEGLVNPTGGGPLMPRYHRATDTVENMLTENGGEKLRRMSTMLGTTVARLANTTL